MKTTILVAGGTGDLGGRIINALLERGAEVRAIVRSGTEDSKVEKLEKLGVKVLRVNMTAISEVTKACEDVSCIVSALQGLHDVIVDTQSVLLDAAIAAGVPRFIPSDFSTDYTQIPVGENRNFDLRREFFDRIDKASISATTIFNGAFAELLNYNIPFLDFKKKSVGYWGRADWRVDFTTMNNTAAFTAAAALDAATPRILRIASFQLTANEMVAVANEVTKEAFKPFCIGSLDELSAQNKRDRAAHPEGEQEVYPNWQRSQYMYSMFKAQNETLDNDCYPDIKWTSAQELLAQRR